MRWLATVLTAFVFVFFGCHQLQKSSANPYQYSAAEDGNKTLLFYNNTGGHVRITTSPGDYYVGKATSGWNCFTLDNTVVTATRGFKFKVTANREINTRYNSDESILGQNWIARLGPNPNVWRFDLGRSFIPTTEPCKD